MIPKNITRNEIIDAIGQIDKNGIPKTRLSRTYNIKYNNKYYPPKYVISLANKSVNGYELKPDEFGGGEETNSFLEKLGFEIVPDGNGYSQTIDKTSSNKRQVKITTVSPESNSNYFFTASYNGLNHNRLKFLKQVLDKCNDSDILLFPAGFLELKSFSENDIKKISNKVTDILREKTSSCIVCFGIDCRDGRDQLAIAVNHNEILAIGRKFYPTADEKNIIFSASSFDTTEIGYKRGFTKKNKRIYLAVCYDCFGIRHQNITNPGYDVILTLAHRFHKKVKVLQATWILQEKDSRAPHSNGNVPFLGRQLFLTEKFLTHGQQVFYGMNQKQV